MGIIRSLLFAICLLGFMVVAVVANVGWWATSTILDEDRFTATAGRALDDPVVTEILAQAAAVKVTDALYARSDLLPPSVTLALRLTPGSQRDVVERGIAGAATDVMDTEAFRGVRDQAIRRMHKALLGDGEAIEVQGDELVLDTGAVVDGVLAALSIDALADFEMPAGTGEIVLVRSERLPQVVSGLRLAHQLQWVILLVAAVLGVLVLLLARSRIHALAWLGVGLLVSGGLGAIVALAEPRLVASAALDPVGQELFSAISADLLRGLLVQSLVLIAAGAILMLIGLIVGRSRDRPAAATSGADPGWA